MQRLDDSFDVPGVSPQRCFDYLADPANGADWASFAKEVRPHGEPGVGRRLEARIGFLGITFGVDSTVTTWDEPHEYVLATSVPFRGEIGTRLSALPDDAGTRVDAHITVDPGKFFPVPGMVLRKALRKQFDKDVGALRTNLRALA